MLEVADEVLGSLKSVRVKEEARPLIGSFQALGLVGNQTGTAYPLPAIRLETNSNNRTRLIREMRRR